MRTPRSAYEAPRVDEQRKYMGRSVALLGRTDLTKTAVQEQKRPPLLRGTL